MNFLLIIFAVAFLVGIAAGVMGEVFPLWIGAVYFAVSLVTVGFYAWDKNRARKSGGRTPEITLHLLELLGGWPGALLAQRILRHKNLKVSYQVTFWLIVLLHLGAWAWAVAAR